MTNTDLSAYGIVGPTFGVPIPPLSPRQYGDPLPFRAQFSALEERVLAGDSPHFLVPTTFWTEERGVDADRATAGYGMRKIRDQFNIWRDQKPDTRSKIALAMLGRRGDMKIEKVDRPGVSVWLTLDQAWRDAHRTGEEPSAAS